MEFSFSRRKAFFALVVALSIVSLPSFYRHLEYFLSGQIRFFMKQNAWLLVFGSIAFFLAFLLPLKYRRKADWRSAGIYTAFLISLFVEMYGLPLSVYLSSAFFSMPSSSQVPAVVLTAFGFSLNIWMLIGLVITLIGCGIVGVGWYTVYNAEGLAKNGIYSFSRHPQYLGIIMISVGWFIGWPTPLTAAILPILVYEYYRLSKKEEQEAKQEFGSDYKEYMKNTPRFI
jgi:protein-S-isoprenylcysteine O-methyltransferase Ste14